MATPLLCLSSNFNKFLIFISIFFVSLFSQEISSQNQIFADQVTFESNVLDSNNALGDQNTFATLNSFGGTILISDAFTGELELQFPSTLPANTTSYIQIGFDDDILNALLGGSLGTDLADIAGGIVLGDHFFNVEARMDNMAVFSGSSATATVASRFRIVTDKDGFFYIAITPDQPYNRVYIEDVTDTLLLGQDNSMMVFNAFYYTATDCAFEPLYTDFDGSGISIDALELGDAGVLNPQFAIDDNETNFSQLNLGVASVNGSILQNIYLANIYSPSAEFSVTIKTEPTLVLLGIVNNVTIKAFNGADEVFSSSLAGGLDVDLLGLLGDGEVVTVVFAPGLSFDRVSVELSTIQPINVSQSLDLFGISVAEVDTPDLDQDQVFCLLDNPTVADLNTNGQDITWYNAPTGGIAFAPTDALETRIYFASQTIDGCEGSIRTMVNVTVNNTPPPTTGDPSQEFCIQDNATIADLQVNETNVTWYDMATGGTAFDSTDPLVNGQIYYGSQTINNCDSTTRLAVTVTIFDTPPPTTNNPSQDFCIQDNATIGDLEVNGTAIIWYDMDSGGTVLGENEALQDGQTYYASQTLNDCESTSRLEVTVTIYDTPPPTTNDDTQEFCIQDGATVGDIDVNETGVTWYDMPIGGTAFSNTAVLINGQTYYGSQILNGCESTSRLEVTVTIYDTPPPTTDDASPEFCIQDNATIADLQVTGTAIIWYDMPTSGTVLGNDEPLVDGQTYYASQTLNNCESTTRLAVTVSVFNTPPPTTTDDNQDFCIQDDPRVSDIDVNEAGVTWFDMPTGGTAFGANESLIDGQTYYGTQILNGCESTSRLAVTVNVYNTPPPTTNDNTQEFCAVDNPTVGDIQVNESDVTWYNMATGGVAFSDTDALIDGQTYYASQTLNGCESTSRLAVLVNVLQTTQPMITSDADGDVCLNTSVTYTTQAGNNNYMWDFTGGMITSGGGIDDNFITILWDTTENTTVTVSYDAANACSTGGPVSIDEVVLVCGDITIDKTVDNAEPVIGDNVTFTITVSNTGPNDFFDVTVTEDLPTGYDLVSFETSTGTFSPAADEWFIETLSANTTETLTIVAEVLPTGDYLNTVSVSTSTPTESNTSNNTSEASTDPLCLEIFNEFSPNNDGVNDMFTITCIERFPNNEISIFNRYGILVYKTRGYNNDWNGKANVSGIAKKDELLPSDTYYYVLTMNSVERPMTGWLYLTK